MLAPADLVGGQRCKGLEYACIVFPYIARAGKHLVICSVESIIAQNGRRTEQAAACAHGFNVSWGPSCRSMRTVGPRTPLELFISDGRSGSRVRMVLHEN